MSNNEPSELELSIKEIDRLYLIIKDDTDAFDDEAKEWARNKVMKMQAEIAGMAIETDMTSAAKAMTEAIRRTGVSASDAAKSIKTFVDNIPQEFWDMIDQEIERRGLK